MRTTKPTRRFKQDFKRAERGSHRDTLENDLTVVIELLRADALVPPRYDDHPMRGRWNGYRDCHIHGDLILIYRKIGASELELTRLGSHSQLSLM